MFTSSVAERLSKRLFPALFVLLFTSSFAKVQRNHSFLDSPAAYLGQTLPSDTPQVFAPGLLADPGTIAYDRIAITPSGKDICYSQNDRWASLKNHVLKCFRYDGHKWQGPTVAFEHFYAATFSLDGNSLFVAGEKPKQVWKSTRTATGWSEPELFLESDHELYDFMPTQSGTYYIGTSADDADKRSGIGFAFSTLTILNGKQTVKSLGRPLNEDGYNGDFFVSPDESFMIVSANETKDLECELHISFRKPDGTWTKPVSLGPNINDGLAHRWGQFVTPDSKYLFYSRGTSAKDCAIYWVRFDNLLTQLKSEALRKVLG
jgi:hypothetical protein